jgi:hypothetical protein
MSGFGDAMTAAIKRRIENSPTPAAGDKAKQAAEAQRRLGFGKETKAKPVDDPGDHEFR